MEGMFIATYLEGWLADVRHGPSADGCAQHETSSDTDPPASPVAARRGWRTLFR